MTKIAITVGALAKIAAKSAGYNPTILLENGQVWGEATEIRHPTRNGRRNRQLVQFNISGRTALFGADDTVYVAD